MMTRNVKRFLAAAALLLAGTASAADIKLGGYAKLDMIWSDKIAGGGQGQWAEFAPGAGGVPLRSEAITKYDDFGLNARESRFNITATDEKDGVKLKGFIEGDFLTDDGNTHVSNSRHLRLRHAYGMATFGNGFFVQGGQYWSNFMNNEQLYNTIDFYGPAGQLFNRSPQLRVGWKGNGVTATASVESSSMRSGGTVPAELAQSPELPLATVKVMYAAGGFTFQVAGVVAQHRSVGTRKTAMGAEAGVEIPVPGLGFPVTIQALGTYLDGLNRLANGDFNDVAVIDGKLQTVKTFGGYAGIAAQPLAKTSVNAYYGYREAKKNDAAVLGKDQLQKTIHANVIQKLWGGLEVGLEYQHAMRQEFRAADGTRDAGEMNRVQGALWYYF